LLSQNLHSTFNSLLKLELSIEKGFSYYQITAMYRSPALIVALILMLLSVCSAAPVEFSALEKRGVVPKLVGSPVVFGAGTYPRANNLSDGSIIGVYTAFSGGNNIIETVRSTDGGKTYVYSIEVFPAAWDCIWSPNICYNNQNEDSSTCSAIRLQRV